MIFPVSRRKFPDQFEEKFTYEDCLHCFYRIRFRTRFEICTDEDGELSDICEIIIPSRLMNYVMIPDKEYFSSTTWIEHEINTLLQKLHWWQKKKIIKKEHKKLSSQLLPAKQKQLQISRN